MGIFQVGQIVRHIESGLVAGEVVKIKPDREFGTLYYVSGSGEKMIPYESWEIALVAPPAAPDTASMRAALEQARAALVAVDEYANRVSYLDRVVRAGFSDMRGDAKGQVDNLRAAFDNAIAAIDSALAADGEAGA